MTNDGESTRQEGEQTWLGNKGAKKREANGDVSSSCAFGGGEQMQDAIKGRTGIGRIMTEAERLLKKETIPGIHQRCGLTRPWDLQGGSRP